MTEFMGYSPEHVRWLREAMVTAADELGRVDSRDVAAAGAMRSVRDARRLLAETWIPLLDTLLAGGLMERYSPAALDGSDLRTASLWALQAKGWTLATDPLTAPPAAATVSPGDARALADMLAGADLDELLDTDGELVWLATRLTAIAADELLLAAFWAGLPPAAQQWIEITDELSARRLAGNVAHQAPIDGVFAAIGLVHHEPEQARRLLAAIEPYAAALVLVRLDLAPDDLAAAAYEIVLRWWVGPDSGGEWMDGAPWGDQAADIVFRHLAADATAATEFLRHAIEHPPILFVTADDQRNVEALLRRGTDPGHVDVATAGEIIVPIMRWMVVRGEIGRVGNGLGPSLRMLAAAAAEPWLVYFVARAEEWGWSEDEARATLAEILRDGDALRRLAATVTTLGAVVAAGGLVTDGMLDQGAVDDIARTFWEFVYALEDREIADGYDMRFVYDVAIAIGTRLVDQVPKSPTAEVVVDVGLPIVLDLFESWDVLPPDRESVRDLAGTRLEQRAIEMAVAVVAVVVLQLAQRGAVAAEAIRRLDLRGLDRSCAPVDAFQRLSAFITGLGLDRDDEAALSGALRTVLNYGGALGLCRD